MFCYYWRGVARDRDKKACSDLTYVERKAIHTNLPFTRSRESKDVESLGTEI